MPSLKRCRLARRHVWTLRLLKSDGGISITPSRFRSEAVPYQGPFRSGTLTDWFPYSTTGCFSRASLRRIAPPTNCRRTTAL